jgi:sulfur carrier protein ThiS
MEWHNKYIGIPYQEKGRTAEEGLDCWGLVRLVYDKEFDITLPSYVEAYEAEDIEKTAELISIHKEGWEPVELPQAGDVVLFSICGQEGHVGIVVRPGLFLHVIEGQASVIESYTSAKWKKRVVGTFRYNELSKTRMSVVPSPLSNIRINLNVPEGSDLYTAISLIKLQFPEYRDIIEKSGTVILVNSVVVPEDKWKDIVLKSTDVVEYRAVAGKSGILRIFAVILIAVVAWYAAPYLAGAGSFGSAGWGVAATSTLTGLSVTATANIIAAGINMVGGLLLNALFPIRPPPPPLDPGDAEEYKMVTGQSNNPQKYGSIPLVLGKVKFSPPAAAIPYYENKTNYNYLHQLLCWGYGPLEITDLKLDEKPLGSWGELEYVTYDGINGSYEDVEKLYPREVVQKVVNQEPYYKDLRIGKFNTDINYANFGISWSGSSITVTTDKNHGLYVGDYVSLNKVYLPTKTHRSAKFLSVALTASGISSKLAAEEQPVDAVVALGIISAVNSDTSFILDISEDQANFLGTYGASGSNSTLINQIVSTNKIETVIDEPVDSIVIDILFPQGCRKIITEGKAAGSIREANPSHMILFKKLDRETGEEIDDEWLSSPSSILNYINLSSNSLTLSTPTSIVSKFSINQYDGYSPFSLNPWGSVYLRPWYYDTSNIFNYAVVYLEENSTTYNVVYSSVTTDPLGETKPLQSDNVLGAWYYITDTRGDYTYVTYYGDNNDNNYAYYYNREEVGYARNFKSLTLAKAEAENLGKIVAIYKLQGNSVISEVYDNLSENYESLTSATYVQSSGIVTLTVSTNKPVLEGSILYLEFNTSDANRPANGYYRVDEITSYSTSEVVCKLKSTNNNTSSGSVDLIKALKLSQSILTVVDSSYSPLLTKISGTTVTFDKGYKVYAPRFSSEKIGGSTSGFYRYKDAFNVTYTRVTSRLFKYKVLIFRTSEPTHDYTSTYKYQNLSKSIIQTITGIKSNDAISYENIRNRDNEKVPLALTSVKVRATSQISGSTGALTGVAHSIVPDYVGINNITLTSNGTTLSIKFTNPIMLSQAYKYKYSKGFQYLLFKNLSASSGYAVLNNTLLKINSFNYSTNSIELLSTVNAPDHVLSQPESNLIFTSSTEYGELDVPQASFEVLSDNEKYLILKATNRLPLTSGVTYILQGGGLVFNGVPASNYKFIYRYSSLIRPYAKYSGIDPSLYNYGAYYAHMLEPFNYTFFTGLTNPIYHASINTTSNPARLLGLPTTNYTDILDTGALWVYNTTSNPASLFRAVLQHNGNAKKIPTSSIDLDNLAYWHTFCEKNGYTYNALHGGSANSVDSVLRDIAAAGRASPTLVNGKWGVVIDEPRDIVVQHFTPYNSWGFEATKSISKIPNAFRVPFYNEAKDWAEDEVLVYNTGYTEGRSVYESSISARVVSTSSIGTLSGQKTIDGVTVNTNDIVLVAGQSNSLSKGHPENGLWVVNTSGSWTRHTSFSTAFTFTANLVIKVLEGTEYSSTKWLSEKTPIALGYDNISFVPYIGPATLYETINLPGVTNYAQVKNLAKFHLAQLRLRPEIYTLNVDMEHIVCTRGDLVKVTHDVPLWGTGSGRITSVSYDGTSLTTISISDYIPLKANTTYRIIVRSSDTILQPSVNDSTQVYTCINKVSDGFYNTLSIAGDKTLDTVVGDPLALILKEDNLFVLGEVGQESAECLVQSIEPLDNLSAKITLVDYSPEIYDLINSDEPILDYVSNISDPVILKPATVRFKPNVVNVFSDESVMSVVSKGRYKYGIKLTFKNISTKENMKDLKFIECSLRPSTSKNSRSDKWLYNKIIKIEDATVLFDEDIDENAWYDFRARYISALGVTGEWTDARNYVGKDRFNYYYSTYNTAVVTEYSNYIDTDIVKLLKPMKFQIQGRINPPKNISGAQASYIDSRVNIDWADNEEPDLGRYEVRLADSNWGVLVDPNNLTKRHPDLVYKGPNSECFYPLPKLDVGVQSTTNNFYLKAVDTAGHFSTDPILLSVPYQRPPAVAGIVTDVKSTTIPLDEGSTVEVNATVSWSPVAPVNGMIIAGYEIRTAATVPTEPPPLSSFGSSSTIDGSALIYRGSVTTTTIPIDPSITNTYYIRAYDLKGNYSWTNSTITIDARPALAAPSSVAGKLILSAGQLEIDWTTTMPRRTKEFEVRTTNSNWWTSNTNLVYRGSNSICKTSELLSLTSTPKTYYLRARDSFGIESAVTTYTHAMTDLVAPSGVIGTPDSTTGELIIDWTTTMPGRTINYEVRTDQNWGVQSTHLIYNGSASICRTSRLLKNGNPTKTYYLRATDVFGQISSVTTFNYSYAYPSVLDDVVHHFNDKSDTQDSITVDWPESDPPFGLKDYKISYPAEVLTLTSISRDASGTIYGTFASTPMNLIKGKVVTISGAANSALNGDATIISRNMTTNTFTAYQGGGTISVLTGTNVGQVVYTITKFIATSSHEFPFNWTATKTISVQVRDNNNELSPVYNHDIPYIKVGQVPQPTLTILSTTGRIFDGTYTHANTSNQIVISTTSGEEHKFNVGNIAIIDFLTGNVSTNSAYDDKYTVVSKTSSTLTIESSSFTALGASSGSVKVTAANATQNLILDWKKPTKGSLPIAGYEVRTVNANWGTMDDTVAWYGRNSQVTLSDIRAGTPMTWYIKAFDTDFVYSDTARVVTHDIVKPNNITSATMKRVGNNLVITINANQPPDFSVYRLIIGKTNDGVPVSGDFWDDDLAVAQCLSLDSKTNIVTISLNRFSKQNTGTRIYSTYRCGIKIVDKGGNESPLAKYCSYTYNQPS